MASTLPWLVLAAIFFARDDRAVDTRLGDDLSPRPSTDAGAPPSPPATAPTGTPSGGTDPAPRTPGMVASGADRGTLAAAGSGGRTSARATDAIGVALVAAHAHLSTVPTPLPVEGIEPAADAHLRYVEHLAAEAIDQPGPELAVVTVVATVLPIETDGYGPGQVVRLAVPVRFGDQVPRPAGQPWPLPPPETGLAAVSGEPVDDSTTTEQATAALEAAGYADPRVTAVTRTDSWAWIVEAEATAPGAPGPERHVVWLRPYLDGFTVAGWLPPARPANASSPPPSLPPGSPSQDPTP